MRLLDVFIWTLLNLGDIAVGIKRLFEKLLPALFPRRREGDGWRRPLLFFLTASQASDYQGARHLLDRLPAAKELLADRGYDADWFRNRLKDKGISPCIPPRKKRGDPADYDKILYKQRYRVENTFGRIKDWRRIAQGMIDTLIPSYRPSSSPQRAAIGWINES